ncbi:glycosyltransferase 87 family protein [Nocardia shimofusensis]|uniref:glycosyltransferase 87 family protein n=1 Tax=Nocardia shimofusensis TaxID=228596 RepID=UPI000A0499D2|nr:glycosyltransferase 87 family protein [Nocardia shimofusensis]
MNERSGVAEQAAKPADLGTPHPDSAESPSRRSAEPAAGPAGSRLRLLAAALALFAVSALVSLLAHWWSGYIDLQVYRNGARVWLDGGELYGPMPPVAGIGLPFTYPPLAALFFAPLALMPLVLAEVVVLLTSLGCLGLTLWLVLARLRPGLDPRVAVPVVIAALALALYLEPVRQTFGFGQINLVLMAAVAVDCLVRKPFWPRGMLIGITVSIKLIPGGFLLYFLLRRDWKAAGTMVVSAIGAVGLGFLLFPSDSVEYWFRTLADTGRIGPPYFAGNQSLKGLAFRLGVPDTAATVVWLVLAVIAVALAAVWMHHLIRAGAHVAALLVNAAAILLVSPVSWSHHWVWAAPALLLTAEVIVRRRAGQAPWRLFAGVAGAITVLYLIGPHWLLPHSEDRELDWAWWQQIIGSSYVLVTLGVLAVAAFTYRPESAASPSGAENAASAAA